jgi:putative membrane protein
LPLILPIREIRGSNRMTLHDLPAVNASLNGMATVLLTAGYVCIRRKKVAAHRAAMLAAFAVSVAFLASYLTYHLQTAPTRFAGTGLIRPVYFALLISHILLAMAIVPLVPITLALALRGRFERHRAWARWTFPIWYYVSVTGVLVYFLLYRWFPAAR